MILENMLYHVATPTVVSLLIALTIQGEPRTRARRVIQRMTKNMLVKSLKRVFQEQIRSFDSTLVKFFKIVYPFFSFISRPTTLIFILYCIRRPQR